jgi:hypothetical protein
LLEKQDKKPEIDINFIKDMLVQTELSFNGYLEKRNSRWATPEFREEIVRLFFNDQIKLIEFCKEPEKLFQIVRQLNEFFCNVDHLIFSDDLENNQENAN